MSNAKTLKQMLLNSPVSRTKSILPGKTKNAFEQVLAFLTVHVISSLANMAIRLTLFYKDPATMV